MIFYVKPESIQHAEIYDLLKRAVGEIRATQWMFSGHAELGGCSPVEAIKSGRVADVRRLAIRFRS